MNARSAVFSYVAIRPCRIKELIVKLPYKRDTIYRAVETLLIHGNLSKGKDGSLRVSPDYESQKLRELYVKALSYGIDPEILMRKNTHAVLNATKVEKTLSEIHWETSLSKKWIARILSFLKEAGLVTILKRKPIIAISNPKHELNTILEAIFKQPEDSTAFIIMESGPFEEQFLDAVNLEKILYEKIDDGLAVKDTGFLVKGEQFKILENVDHELGLEELFLIRILTLKGVENDCIRLIVHGSINYDTLMQLAIEKNLLNIVGCYLDIINDIEKLIEPKIIAMFLNKSRQFKNVSHFSRPIFLKEEKKYGKAGWETNYEEKWGIDLYLDIGAIRHGVRGV